MDISKFVQSTVGIVISCVIVVGVGIPIIVANQVSSSVENYQVINTILNILPVFLIIAILVSSVAIMKFKSRD